MMKITLFHHQISLVVTIAIGIMTIIGVVNGQEFEMKCTDDQCTSYFDTMVIDGCTMMASSDGSSMAFTFDPMAEDPTCALKFYSDANCNTTYTSCTDYDVSDSSVICSFPGTSINPCGTGIGYKIAKVGADDDTSSATMTTSTTSVMSAMMMMSWSLLW
jgi:hypothetical protein